MQLQLGIIDLIVLALVIASAIAIGFRARGKSGSVEGFLLGDRNLPWWAILGSIVATETSTATVLSLPGEGFGDSGMRFLQLAFGFIVGRTIVAVLLMPYFFQPKQLFSAYEVLKRRFGVKAQTASSLLFLGTRNIGDGLRLFLAAIVLQTLVGWPFVLSAVAIGGVTVLYTWFGGMRSVVWNDCIQFLIYVTGGIITVFVIVAGIEGGWTEAGRFASHHEKFEFFTWRPAPDYEGSFRQWLISEPFTIWAGLIGGAILTIGTHGTDQMMVQRYLSARSRSDAGRAVILSAIIVLLQFALFLFIGVLLACFYAQQPEIQFDKPDEVFAHFIVHSFPKNSGLAGLMIAALLAATMSTLSSSLNSCASSVVNDLYLPLVNKPPDPDALLTITRWLCVFFGVLQVLLGIWAQSFDASVVSNALTIAGYSAGLLLGLFALGVLTRRVNEISAILGAITGLAGLLIVQFILPGYGIKVAWPWFALIGSGTTYLAGLFFSTMFRRGLEDPPLDLE